jgi:hypothetical protein
MRVYLVEWKTKGESKTQMPARGIITATSRQQALDALFKWTDKADVDLRTLRLLPIGSSDRGEDWAEYFENHPRPAPTIGASSAGDAT